ncbi:MAG: HipA domain-containing protein [Pseudomonadota bacterium]
MSQPELLIGLIKMASGELNVTVNNELVGHLIDGGGDDWRFIYQTPAARRRISVNFPIRESAYAGKDVLAFFRNALPSGDTRRAAVSQLGFSSGNDFALIGALCNETFGALRISTADYDGMVAGELRELNETELRHAIAALAMNPLLTKVDGYRNSLPGENSKLAVRTDNNTVYLPLGSELSTHIIKPPRPERRESLENESFCMSLARELGLPVAAVELRRTAANYLLVERIDRRIDGSNVQQIHAEDFCQLALLPPENVFEREGGIAAHECVGLLRDYSVQPGYDIKLFLKWLIFNYLIGNGHATAKQLSLQHTQNGPKLAPFYGLSSTHIYASLNGNLGMGIGAEDRPDWIIAGRWRAFAERAGVAPRYVFELLEEMAAEIILVAPRVEALWQKENGYAEVTGIIRRLTERRARQIAVGLQAEVA